MSSPEQSNTIKKLLNPAIVLAIALALCFLTAPAESAVTTTSATVNASLMTANAEICVKMEGSNSGAAEAVWFMYGNNETGFYSFKTPNQTIAGAFNKTICGFPWLPGETFAVLAKSTNSTGSPVTVAIPTITPHPTTTYEDLVDRFIEAGDDPKTMMQIVWEPYITPMGGIFFGLVTIGVFSNIAIKQKTVFLSLLLAILCGGTLWSLFTDEPAIVQFAQIIITAGCIGMFYFLITKPR